MNDDEGGPSFTGPIKCDLLWNWVNLFVAFQDMKILRIDAYSYLAVNFCGTARIAAKMKPGT